MAHRQTTRDHAGSKSVRPRNSATPEKLEQLLPELLGVPREQIPVVQRALKKQATAAKPPKTRSR